MSTEHVKKGNISEQKFILYCLEKDIKISRPLFNDARYDFIIDINTNLYRIQVKTGYHGAGTKENRLTFNTANTVCTMSQIKKKDYIGDIDYFAVYSKDFIKEDFLFIPIDKATNKSMIICCDKNDFSYRTNNYTDYLELPK